MNLGVDGNWVLHRVYHTLNDDLKDPAGHVARRFLSMVCRDAIFVKAKQVLVAFDGAKVFRYKIYPDYKGNRDKSDGASSVYDYLQPLLDYLAMAGVHVVQLQQYEADDVLCSLAAHTPVTISTRDKDAYQYLAPGVTLMDPSAKIGAKTVPKMTTAKDVKSLIGVPVSASLDYQTLIGDKIDNVPQLITPAKAREGLLKHGSIKNWLSTDPEFRKAMKARKEELNLNRKLVRLVPDIEVEAKPIKWLRDLQSMPQAYVDYHSFCNPKTRSLF